VRSGRPDEGRPYKFPNYSPSFPRKATFYVHVHVHVHVHEGRGEGGGEAGSEVERQERRKKAGGGA